MACARTDLGAGRRRSQLTVLAITGAFFQLFAILLTSLLWFAMPSSFAGRAPLSLVLGVLIQESTRFVFVYLYGRAEQAIVKAGDTTTLPFTELSSAVASGFGIGLLSSLVTYGDVLAASLGEADYFIPGCPGVSLFIASAFQSLALQILHVSLTIVAFDGRRSAAASTHARRGIIVLALHMGASLSSLANNNAAVGGCALGLSLYFIIVALALALATRTARNML